jgi:hypothetical protein
LVVDVLHSDHYLLYETELWGIRATTFSRLVF